MEWTDEAFVLSSRPHGETGAVVDFLCRERGRWAAHVAGGSSRRLKPHLQQGARVTATFRSRTDEQLGSATIEPAGAHPAALFDAPLPLMGLQAAAAVAKASLPEREAHPEVFLGFDALAHALAAVEAWPAIYVRFEAGLLDALGFGLDLSACAASGVTEDLVWVSPRTGRAVSRQAGAPFADRLLALPDFLRNSRARLSPGDVEAGLRLTGHFLRACVFAMQDRPLPEVRDRLMEKLIAEGRG